MSCCTSQLSPPEKEPATTSAPDIPVPKPEPKAVEKKTVEKKMEEPKDEIIKEEKKVEVFKTRKHRVSKKEEAPKEVSLEAPNDTPMMGISANHPSHFYKNIKAQVAITLGVPLPAKTNTVQEDSEIPTAAAYSIMLKGDPEDQFIISPLEQAISAPSASIPSSTAYFDVMPLSRGHKILHYYVKARLSVQDPGIGLPELHKDILVEVNGKSVWVTIKTVWLNNLGKILAAAGSAVGGFIIKKWLDKKKA